MRFSRLADVAQYERSLYLRTGPYLGFFALGLLVASFLWPAYFQVASRIQLIPFAVMVLSNVLYLIGMRRRPMPAKIDRIRVGVTLFCQIWLFSKVNPATSALWLILTIPLLGQVVNASSAREGRIRLALFVSNSVLVFALHFPGFGAHWYKQSGWALASVTRLLGLACLAAYAWHARKHERQQNRALMAAYNKLAEKQKQIIQSERLAALGELSAGVAHEVNNPLTVVICGVDQLECMLKEGSPDTALMSKQIERMNRAAGRIQKVVSQLRSLSRDASMDPPEYFDLRQTVDEAVDLLKEQLSVRGIRCEVNLPTERIPVVGHDSELCQVMINLITNARDAMEDSKGERQLRITVAGEKGKAVVCVRDTGTGIPETVQQRIFKPFVTTKPAGRGTGLGLSVSHGIVLRHRGHMRFVTVPGRGTEFLVELPLASEAAAA